MYNCDYQVLKTLNPSLSTSIIPEVQKDDTDSLNTIFQHHTPFSVIVIHVAVFILNCTSIIVIEDKIVFLILDF